MKMELKKKRSKPVFSGCPPAVMTRENTDAKFSSVGVKDENKRPTLDEFKAKTGVTVNYVAVKGSAAEEIANQARLHKSDAIVIGTNGRRGIDRP